MNAAPPEVLAALFLLRSKTDRRHEPAESGTPHAVENVVEHVA